jgi:hypothetical protein
MEHKVYLTLARYKDKNGVTRHINSYHAEYNGERILTSDVAEYDIARYLLNNNIAKPDDILLTYNNGQPSMRGSIKWYAEHTIEESDKVSPRTVKWKPFDVSKVRS